MTTEFKSGPVSLRLTNFGPVSDGEIELRPMTVFVGPSNSGKSFAAALVYALHNFFNDDSREIPYMHSRGVGSYDSILTPIQESQLSERNCNYLFDWFMDVFPGLIADDALARGRLENRLLELPQAVADLVRPYLQNVSSWAEDLDLELARCLGVDNTSRLIQYPGTGTASISLQRSNRAQQNEYFGYEITLTPNGLAVDSSVSEEVPFHFGSNTVVRRLPARWRMNPFLLRDDSKREVAISLLVVLADEIAYRLLDPVSTTALFLPSDRAGIMHASQVVVQSLIASASRKVQRPGNPRSSMSGLLGDYLEKLIELVGASQAKKGIFAELAADMEDRILGGNVGVERKEIDFPSFVFRPRGWDRDLPLINSSSMVSELLPIVMYLRHVVQTGDLLIIEGPEAHLHPELQARLTRLLVAAVNSGIRILITTHSEWILEELANLVRLSELPFENRDGIEDPEIALSPEQLGAWFFEPSKDAGGSVIREISLDEESATFPAGFGLVTEALYNRWVEISTRIQEE